MHELLPMFGKTHGNQGPVTCHLKCGDACAHPAPNTSAEPTFAEIAGRQLSRRAFLMSNGVIAASRFSAPVSGGAGHERGEMCAPARLRGGW